VTLAAETGRHVAKGTIIARIDSRDFEVQLHTTQARLAASRACLEEATLQFERYAKLVREKASAKATYDRVKAAYETAQAQVAEDTRRVETARNALSDTALSAPYDGYIHHKYVENYETVAAGQPVVSMVDLSAIEVGVALPENFLPIVNQFRSFSCRFDALPGASFTACLKEVGKQPNATTRTYPMTLVLEPGKARTVPQVRPGMAAEVTITIACNDNDARCFMVPVTAVANDSDHQSFVWLLDNEKQAVQHHPVTVTGVTDHGLSITGDLKAGQWVVSAGVHYLTNHQRVRLLQPPGLSNVGAEP
jgi:RND family efflux transporter MFP subunit